TVAEGRLDVNGSLGLGTLGSVTVANGATLGGTGTVGGPVIVQAGGTLAPGDANPGTLAISGNLGLNASSRTAVRLGGGSPGNGAGFYSQVNVTGAATLDGILTLDTAGGFDPTGGTYFVLSRGSVGGVFAGLPEGSVVVFDGGMYQGSITYQADWTG